MDSVIWGAGGFFAVLCLLALGIHVGLALAIVGFLGLVGMTGSLTLALGLLTPPVGLNVYSKRIYGAIGGHSDP